MTNERAIQVLEILTSIDGDVIIEGVYKKALEMAIRSLQQEQPSEDLEKEVEWEWVHREKQEVDLIECAEMDKDEFVRFARHFYELGKQSKEPVSEDLEEAAEEYSRGLDYYHYTGDDPAIAFVAGAEWQKEQFLKGDRLTELDKSYKQAKRELEWFKEGKRQGKEEMLKDAVEGFIFQSADYYPKQLIAGYDGELGMGDKVKIVIVPIKK